MSNRTQRSHVPIHANAMTSTKVPPVEREFVSGVSSVQAEFCRVIDFAILQGAEAATFLDAWRHGDTSEWPEFKPDPLPTPDSFWVHKDGAIYQVIQLANVDSTQPDRYPVTVVYRGEDGKVWSRPASDWYRSMRQFLT